MVGNDDPNRTASAVNEVKQRHQATLTGLPHVTGVGVGPGTAGGPVIKVYVGVQPGAAGDPRPDIPSSLEGVPVEVEFMERPRKR